MPPNLIVSWFMALSYLFFLSLSSPHVFSWPHDDHNKIDCTTNDLSLNTSNMHHTLFSNTDGMLAGKSFSNLGGRLADSRLPFRLVLLVLDLWVCSCFPSVYHASTFLPCCLLFLRVKFRSQCENRSYIYHTTLSSIHVPNECDTTCHI